MSSWTISLHLLIVASISRICTPTLLGILKIQWTHNIIPHTTMLVYFGRTVQSRALLRTWCVGGTGRSGTVIRLTVATWLNANLNKIDRRPSEGQALCGFVRMHVAGAYTHTPTRTHVDQHTGVLVNMCGALTAKCTNTHTHLAGGIFVVRSRGVLICIVVVILVYVR